MQRSIYLRNGVGERRKGGSGDGFAGCLSKKAALRLRLHLNRSAAQDGPPRAGTYRKNVLQLNRGAVRRLSPRAPDLNRGANGDAIGSPF
jgi:hypothetical protein